MPLFRALADHGGGAKARFGQRGMGRMKCKGSWKLRTDEDGSVLPLTRLCLLSLADSMKDVWAKDYADNYLDQYFFRHIMGPFSLLPGELVEELTSLLCARKQLSRAALHLLLVPQLRGLSLRKCLGLVNSALCPHIAARCQGLWSLDLSGAQQLPSKVLSETLYCLPNLRSLSLAGTPCDRSVISTVAHRCPLLRHLDVSCCHFLSPAALLPLGRRASFSSSDSPSVSSSPRRSSARSHSPLSSLLALDIGFGEQEGDPRAAAAYLLLSLPRLERLAMDGLAQACRLIQRREFIQTDEFTDREGVPRLGEVWKEWRHRQGMDGWRREKEEEAAAADEEDEERILWEAYGSEGEGDASGNEDPSCSQNQAEGQSRGRGLSRSDEERVVLRLKDVKGLTCDSLDSFSRLCPNIYSLSVSADDHEGSSGSRQGRLLAAGLQTWSGQLRRLSVHYSGTLRDIFPALHVAGSSLLSLTLEGMGTSPHTPLLEVVKACPRLRELFISADPPSKPPGADAEVHRQDDDDLPRLPDLCSLTLKFSYEHSQMKPVMSWMSLRRVLKCLLTGSPLLEKLSLVSLPCPLDCLLLDVLRLVDLNQVFSANSADQPLLPLARVRHVDLQRTDVKTITVKSIMLRSKRLKFVDVSYCWQISQYGWIDCKTFRKIEVVWV